MLFSGSEPRFALKLYVRLCAVLVPSFLLISAIGLYFVTEYVVDMQREQLSVRIGNGAARAGGSLERLIENKHIPQNAFSVEASELLNVLITDPAIMCAELINLENSKVIAKAPMKVACDNIKADHSLRIPLDLYEDIDLVVHSSYDEIAKVKQLQYFISGLILFTGLAIALLTNWVTFRIVVLKPLVTLFNDMDAARQKAEVEAQHDSLTGLANRRQLEDALHYHFDKTYLHGGSFSVLHIDLDHFKQINDTLGHAAGDEVLQHVTVTIQSVIRSVDLLARVGGDEFILIVPGHTRQEQLSEIAQRIVDAISNGIWINDQYCTLSCSIGIEAVRNSTKHEKLSIERLLMNADIALFEAKNRGRGCHVFFSNKLRQDLEFEKKLADDLRNALANKEFTCHYQPQYSVQDNKIVGVEALVRWNHPDQGMLAPDRFLPMCDRLQMTAQIDAFVLQKVIQDLADWDREKLGIETVSVNVSAHRIEDPDLISKLKSLNIPPGRIIFEILETAFLDELSETVIENIEAIRNLGIDVEIDDFGTGKASVLGVMAIVPKRLKIAKEFVLPVVRSDSQLAMLRALIALGQTLDVEMVAEGIETQEHFAITKDLGFARMQGYFIGKPVDVQNLPAHLMFNSDKALQPETSQPITISSSAA